MEVDSNKHTGFVLSRRSLQVCNVSCSMEIGKYVPGDIRDSKKPPQLWMVINIHHGRCWCGKPRGQWGPRQRRYCCHRHYSVWAYGINPTWDIYRDELVRAVRLCEVCGHRGEQMDVDHIEALALGGSMWDSNNRRVLCKDCHVTKTGCDIRKIARQWREKKLEERHNTKYDGKTLLDYAGAAA